MSITTLVDKKRVFVAMSGGVDSSIAAALLKRQGYNITGVFMKPWSPRVTNPKSEIRNPNCLWQRDREDAMRVAVKIGIPLLTWDFSKEYKREVVDYMIKEYKAGRTPNPDVMCNRRIKFGLFLERALKEGADYIATGHYIRIQKSKIKNQNNKLKFKNIYKLLTAKDGNKDQSYFLWTLTQEQLKYCLFPVGDYAKPEVRRMAKKFGLPTYNKKDSQGVCFIGPLDMKEFLKNHIEPKRGDIILLDTAHPTRSARLGRIVGQHDGAFYYTIGQRHGLDIKNGKGPYYVVKKDIKKNIVYVGGKNDLRQDRLQITDVNFIHTGLKFPAKVNIRIRYRSGLVPAIIRNSSFMIQFSKPIRAITSGQSAVFYKGEELLGGGIII